VLSPVPGVFQDFSVSGGLQFSLDNEFKTSWEEVVNFANTNGWDVIPASQAFSLEPGKRVTLQGAIAVPATLSRGEPAIIDASLKLPDGTPFFFPIFVQVRPTLVVSQVFAGFAWNQASAWGDISQSFALDQADQVMVGRAPALTSAQEEKYWKGPTELSGKAKIAADEQNLFVYLEVQDANFKLPDKWPGVLKAYPSSSGGCFHRPSNLTV